MTLNLKIGVDSVRQVNSDIMRYTGLVPNILNLPVICVISNTILGIRCDDEFKKIVENKFDFSSIAKNERFLSTRTAIIDEKFEGYKQLTIKEIEKWLETNYVVVYRLDYDSVKDSDVENYKFYCFVLSNEENPKIEINSKYLIEIVQDLLNGKITTDSVKYINALDKLARNAKEVVENPDFFKENWKFNDNKNPSQEEIENFKKIYDKFIEENNVKVVDLVDFDKVLDAISKFYDNNDPFSLLKFDDKFDRSILKEDADLNYRYNEAMEHQQILNIKMLYGRWRPVLEKQFDLNNNKFNKYLIALYYESVDKTIDTYQLLKGVVLNKKRCVKILPEVIKKLHNEFNPFDFVEKYYMVQSQNHHKNFTNLFISQYIKLYKPEPKLF